MTVRFAISDDYEAIVQVLQAEIGEWAPSEAGLAYEDASQEPNRFHRRLVIEEAGRIVGQATFGHDPVAHRNGKFLFDLRVHPAGQGLGYGKALYQAMVDQLAPMHPRELVTMVWHESYRAMRFLQERGFVAAWRRMDLHLDVSTFDFGAYQQHFEKLSRSGIRILTYADLKDDVARDAKLHALDEALWKDVPYGEVRSERTLDEFVKAELFDSDFLPDACFIATRDSNFIGYLMMKEGRDFLLTAMTGVLRDYRGQSVATALKSLSIQYAQAKGNLELRTINDSVNTAMLALNRKLGFVVEGEDIRFVKHMDQRT